MRTHPPGVRRRMAWLAVGCAFAAPSHASVLVARSQLADLSLEQLSNVVVTSVSRREERLADAATSIYVITAQDIRASGATTLPELLRLAPNLSVARADATQYAVSARGFNNVLANKMLVLIDGRAVYTPLFSGVFWEAQDVVIEDIDRVEVISGPGATLWGANAVNGVINIISRSAAETQGLLATAGHGNKETGGALRFGGALGDARYRFYAKNADRGHTKRADGTAVRDSKQMAQAGLRIDWEKADSTLTVQGDAYEGAIDQVGLSREISGYNALARWTRKLEDDAVLNVQAYFDHTNRYHPREFGEKLDTWDIEGQYGFAAGAHRVLVGGGVRFARDDVTNFSGLAFVPPRRDLRWHNVFAQDRWSLGDDIDVTLGVKLENNPYTGSEFLPSARFAWRVADERLLWGALSRAVRAPSRLDRELFVPANPPFVIEASPMFASEVSTVAELGFRARPSAYWSYSVTGFHHGHDKLRSVGPGGTSAMFLNDIEGRTFGLEGWARVQLTETLALNVGGVHLRQRLAVRAGGADLNGLAALGNDPDSWFKARASWAITPRHDIDVSVRHYGALPNPSVPAYTAVDLRFAWRIRPGLEASLMLQNVADAEHAEWGTPATRAVFERAAFLKVTWRL